MATTTVIFDAYGTLFDVAAPAREAASAPGGEALAEVWEDLARLWRDKQLDYTWLRAAAGRHADFRTVTEESLDWTLASLGLEEPGLRATLLGLYDRLAAFPEVPDVLAALKARGLATGILSNGTPQMLASAVEAAGIGGHLDAVLSAEDAGIYKPAAAVYALVGRHFGCAPVEVLFVSSNGWDAAAASGYGFTSVWVNRAGAPRERLWAAPEHELTDLTPLPEIA
ncbi:haloacid dehalogenase type II [Pseudoroseicyclus tamaricis]|uniref:(S)-2-haloacid dehalogenase n=1 Tax=Pseudoroseicyclus tamaricis TaxID=2705421 RepID=A0A6B2JZS2_9RHOB|nr:haloacid dehalogenase type II [Pseudoroseicyclus tamaricis]NDV01754.1 haloacid dehalogenase type II [Pseudoroseicyclus tamaricis]